jgi:hypothetical protein
VAVVPARLGAAYQPIRREESPVSEQQQHWILHLPTRLTSLQVARGLAASLRQSLPHVDVIDFGETTLSEEDHQLLRHRVWCDSRLPDNGRRCGLADGHAGRCSEGDAGPAD